MFKFVLGSVVVNCASATFLARDDPAPDSHVLLTCDYDASQVIDLPAHQEPSAFFSKEDWQANSVAPPDDQNASTGFVTVEDGGKYIFDQRVRILAFTKIWNVIPKFFSSYFPDARWWLQGHALLGALRTGTSSPWLTKAEVTVGSDSFNSFQVYETLLNISRDNSIDEVDRVEGSSCNVSNNESCNLIRFPSDIDESGTVVLAIKMLPHYEERMIGRFVDLQSGTFVDLSTLGKEDMTPVNPLPCTLDGSPVNVPLNPVKYLKDSRFPDINSEAHDGQIYWKTVRQRMRCSLFECPGDPVVYTADPQALPDPPFWATFVIPKGLALEDGGWTPISRHATGWHWVDPHGPFPRAGEVDECQNVTDQMASFTGGGGDTRDDPNVLGRINVNAQCRYHEDENSES